MKTLELSFMSTLSKNKKKEHPYYHINGMKFVQQEKNLSA